MALLLKQLGYLALKLGGKILLGGDPGAVSHLLAPPWRTVDTGNGQTVNITFASPLDPQELKYYTIDWATELDGTQDAIATSDFALSPTAIAAGLMLHATTNDTRRVTVWLKVDPAVQSSFLFEGNGEIHTMTTRITTVGGQIFERTIRLSVRQL